jgi:ABC-type branched-subunit amino acid transport system substrate-binding protein
VLEGVYGTPQTAALNKKLEEDKILGTSPGFGSAAAADGKRYPYTFPIAASYWSQAGAAVAFVKEKLARLKGKKIAFIFYDNPAGRSRCRSSRTSPRARASSCAPSRCRRRASRWARRCSTSPAASSPTS